MSLQCRTTGKYDETLDGQVQPTLAADSAAASKRDIAHEGKERDFRLTKAPKKQRWSHNYYFDYNRSPAIVL